jgi:hypothetical protein
MRLRRFRETLSVPNYFKLNDIDSRNGARVHGSQIQKMEFFCFKFSQISVSVVVPGDYYIVKIYNIY